MAYINVNTESLKTIGIELREISKELAVITNDLYGKLVNVSNNGVWTSGSENGSANVFISAVTKDREIMKKYEHSLNQLGDQIVYYGKQLENTSNSQM